MRLARPPDLVEELHRLAERARLGNIVAQRRALGPEEPWRYLGDPGQPAFAAGWGSYSGEGRAAFFRDKDGFVHLKGTLNYTGPLGAGATVFTLPAGYRPSHRTVIPKLMVFKSNGFTAPLEVATVGTVSFPGGDPGRSVYPRYLDGIFFRAAQ